MKSLFDAEVATGTSSAGAAQRAPGKATLASRVYGGSSGASGSRSAPALDLTERWQPAVESEPVEPEYLNEVDRRDTEFATGFAPPAPVHAGMRAQAESSLGTDLGSVAVHQGPEASAFAAEHSAMAVTVGHDVFLGPEVRNEPGPILAHELAHAAQQGAAGEVAPAAGRAGAGHEAEADHAAHAIMHGESAQVSSAPVQPATFSPDAHENATVEGLSGGGFSADEIAAIYQSNWERDFSQGLKEFGAAVLAWKNVKMSAAKRGGNPDAGAAAAFRTAAYAVVDVDAYRLVMGDANESLSGYFAWEHMDNPGEKKAKEADERWKGKSAGLAGYICDGVAYVKEQMIEAVNVYREFHKLEQVGGSIDPWKGAKPPEGYNKHTVRTAAIEGDNRDPGVSREGLHAETKAKAADKGVGDQAKTAAEEALWKRIGHHLGRAMHSFEDFWAHSNWLELAKHEKDKLAGDTSPAPGNGALETGTFEMADKAHALGHKVTAMAGAMQGDFGLMLKVYNRTKASTKFDSKKKSKWWQKANEHDRAFGPLETDSWTSPGEMYDIFDATQNAEEMVQSGEAKMEDFLCNPAWIAALHAKGEKLKQQGESDTDDHGHGKLAKDQPEGDKDHGGAAAIAAAANKRAFEPLKGVMKEKDPAKAEAAITKQIAEVDALIQAPSSSHPLWDLVPSKPKPAKPFNPDDNPRTLPPGQEYG